MSSGHRTASTWGSNTQVVGSQRTRAPFPCPRPLWDQWGKRTSHGFGAKLRWPQGTELGTVDECKSHSCLFESILRRQVAGDSLLSQLSPITPICVCTYLAHVCAHNILNTHVCAHMQALGTCVHTCTHSARVLAYIHMLSTHAHNMQTLAHMCPHTCTHT